MKPSVIESQILGVQPEYENLCHAANIQPLLQNLNLNDFTDSYGIAEKSLNERVHAALQVFLDLFITHEESLDRIDKILLDRMIHYIDQVLNHQLDEILHHPEFQKLESLWCSLKYLVDSIDFKSNIKLEMIDAAKADLADDFANAAETTQSGLYKHVYEREYDTPGGEPISVLVTNFEFDNSVEDLNLLREFAKVSAAAHAPILGSVGPKFFNKETIDAVVRIEDLTNYMERAEYIRWNAFRETEDARYVGLTLPRFLLRLPYGEQNRVKSFHYQESVTSSNEKYLWGNASFALAANMAQSFKKHGWAVNIRGPESGGKVTQLPLHQYEAGRGFITKIPTECLIPETRELELATLGFVPLSYYLNSDYACFFSANSVQKPQIYNTLEATANSRINARLPYIFLSSRLAHYLKVLQRENIGSNKNRNELETELNQWLQTLVTKMNDPGPELAATHPLREGKILVEPIDGNPGFFKATLYVMPHFQIEGMDINLSLVAQIPTGEIKK